MTAINTASILAIAQRARFLQCRGNALRAAGVAAFWVGISFLACAVITRVAAHWFPAVGAWQVGASLGVLAAAGLTVAIVHGWRRGRMDDLTAAALVDERLELSSRLSSALAFSESADPFAVAAVEDGVRCAAASDLPARLRASFTQEIPARSWWGVGAIAAAAAVLALVPTWPPENPPIEIDPALLAEVSREANAKADAVIEQVMANPELAAALGGSEESSDAAHAATASSPEDIRRAAARRMVDLQQKLEKVLSGSEAAQLAALERALASMPMPTSGETTPLAEALKRGDFAEASKQLKELAAKGASPEMDRERMEQLSKDLERLAKALEDAAARRQDLRDALAEAGMDPDLASNPAAIEQAMRAMQGLTESQREALKQAMQSQQRASSAAQQMAKACRACSGGASGGRPGENANASSASELSEGQAALDEFAKFDEMMAAAQGGLAQCSGGAAAALSGGDGESVGLGNQGKGRGMGGEAQKMSTATGTRIKREKVENAGGEIIARQMVANPNPESTEATAALREISRSIGRAADAGTPEDPVPPHLREAHRKYFGEVKRRIDQKLEGAPGSPASPASPSKGNSASGGA